jgi:hypothetical protein
LNSEATKVTYNPVLGSSRSTLGELTFAIFIEIDRHRLRHNITVETHLEWKIAGIGIAGRGVWNIRSDAAVIDNLLIVQPCADYSVWLRTEAYLEAQVEPFAAEVTFLLVEDDELVVEILRDAEDAADVAHSKHGAVIAARGVTARTILPPLCYYEANRDDREVCWQVHTPGKLIELILASREWPSLQEFISFTVGIAAKTGKENIARMQIDAKGAMACTNDAGLYSDWAGDEYNRVPEVTQGGPFKTVVDVDGSGGCLG